MGSAYDGLAESYDEQLKDKRTRAMYKEWRAELELALKKYRVNPGILIDLGCGTGITTLPWVDKFGKVVGVEISKPMLEEAMKKSSKVEWVNKDIVNFQAREKADAVTCHFAVLNHVLKKKDLQKVFNNVYKSLNPNGLFIFDVIPPESFEWLKNKGRKSTIPERPYSKEEITRMLKKSKFKILKVKKQKAQEWDRKPRRVVFLAQREDERV